MNFFSFFYTAKCYVHMYVHMYLMDLNVAIIFYQVVVLIAGQAVRESWSEGWLHSEWSSNLFV